MWDPPEHQRSAPAVFRADDAAAGPTRPRPLWTWVICAAICLVLIGLNQAFGSSGWVSLWANVAICTLVGVVITVTEHQAFRRAERAADRRAVGAAEGAVSASGGVRPLFDPAVERSPREEAIDARLAELGALQHPGGVVVTEGLDPPFGPGDYRFEPEVLTPGRIHGWPWWLLFLVGLPALWAGLRLAGVRADACTCFGNAIVFGGGGAVFWTWGMLVRPRYVRLAPGVVQVLRYTVLDTAPRVRSYALAPGTRVLVSRAGAGVRVKLKAADGTRDVLVLDDIAEREHCVERLWRALLSTAPTPPLSAEELVG